MLPATFAIKQVNVRHDDVPRDVGKETGIAVTHLGVIGVHVEYAQLHYSSQEAVAPREFFFAKELFEVGTDGQNDFCVVIVATFY